MGANREPTEQERNFVRPLQDAFAGLQDWYLSDSDGTPWLMLSYDFLAGGGVSQTLRLDYDGQTLEGGWSPASLNWDAETRAREVPIETATPGGLSYRPSSDADALECAHEWLARHIGVSRDQG